jgi:hypothetical protein
VWWKQANKLALIISSNLCGILFICISPYVLPNFVVGKGLAAALGMSGGMVTVPLSFALFIVLSLLFNKMPGLQSWAPSLADKKVIDRIHGWGDYDESRYNSAVWPLILAGFCVIISIWGLQPWT